MERFQWPRTRADLAQRQSARKRVAVARAKQAPFYQAARFVSLDRLGLSPQCGFASSVGGNPITEEDQRRKLELVVETAAAVWGR